MSKPRKPRGIEFPGLREYPDYAMPHPVTASILPEDSESYACAYVVAGSINSDGCRRLAAWLLKAADYLDSKDGGR